MKITTLSTIFFLLILTISSSALKKTNLKGFIQTWFVPNCASYDASGACWSCSQGFVWTSVRNGQYFCTPWIGGCETYGPNGNCSKCNADRAGPVEKVEAGKVCPCGNGFVSFDAGLTCHSQNSTITGCAVLLSRTSCKTCQDGYYKDIMPSSKHINYFCKTCESVFPGQGCKKCEQKGKFIHCTQQ